MECYLFLSQYFVRATSQGEMSCKSSILVDSPTINVSMILCAPYNNLLHFAWPSDWLQQSPLCEYFVEHKAIQVAFVFTNKRKNVYYHQDIPTFLF